MTTRTPSLLLPCSPDLLLSPKALRLREFGKRRVRRGRCAGDRGGDALGVDMGILDVDREPPLRARDRGARDVQTWNARLHGRRIVHHRVRLTLQSAADLLEERAVRLVADLQQDVVDGDDLDLVVGDRPKPHEARGDLDRLRAEPRLDETAADARFKFGSDPVLDPRVHAVAAI